MRKFISTLALAATFFPSVVLAQPGQQRFTRDGVTYVYTVKAANGRQVIEGHRLPSGSAFRLVVSGNHVDGESGGQPVSFRAPSATGVSLAAR